MTTNYCVTIFLFLLKGLSPFIGQFIFQPPLYTRAIQVTIESEALLLYHLISSCGTGWGDV